MQTTRMVIMLQEVQLLNVHKKKRNTLSLRWKKHLEVGPSDTKKKINNHEYRVADMRLCVKCNQYVRENCVGFTAKDKITNFICPICAS
ncbi:hypothetical protein PR048_019407 [Dryococelus australis]|uniref:Uncharacterized protein n=1 Tax=Dryococelus australis TaxID=614101 RepID=A0ABQ9H3E1_9NEOP|nr:hypothetical protein PR048_019407 [Dryococelus australis]